MIQYPDFILLHDSCRSSNNHHSVSSPEVSREYKRYTILYWRIVLTQFNSKHIMCYSNSWHDPNKAFEWLDYAIWYSQKYIIWYTIIMSANLVLISSKLVKTAWYLFISSCVTQNCWYGTKFLTRFRVVAEFPGCIAAALLLLYCRKVGYLLWPPPTKTLYLANLSPFYSFSSARSRWLSFHIPSTRSRVPMHSS